MFWVEIRVTVLPVEVKLLPVIVTKVPAPAEAGETEDKVVLGKHWLPLFATPWQLFTINVGEVTVNVAAALVPLLLLTVML